MASSTSILTDLSIPPAMSLPEIIDVDEMYPLDAEAVPVHSDALSITSNLGPTTGMTVYIELPHLTTDEKQTYTHANISDSSDDGDSDASEVKEFVGEYKVGNMVFLYGKCQDGLYRRDKIGVYRRRFPEEFKRYTRRKSKGTLPAFNPSGPKVHPKHRASLQISINKRRVLRGRGSDALSSSGTDAQSPSSSSDELDELSSGSDYGQFSRGGGSRKSVRRLPFSPRRVRKRPLRSSANNAQSSDQSEEEYEPRDTRTRVVKSRVVFISSDSDSPRPARRKAVKKAIRPEYGKIRDVDDPYDSDLSTAPLRAHLETCEKCHREPAHVLLRKIEKKGKRKRKVDDLEEDEETFYEALGGWVRCLKCPVTQHWGCLNSTQKQEILKAAREKLSTSTQSGHVCKTLDSNETTEFLCNFCSKGGLCSTCGKIAVEADNFHTPSRSNGTVDVNSTSQDNTTPQIQEIGSSTSQPEGTASDATKGDHDISKDDQQSHSVLPFRCSTCKRLWHYDCLRTKDDASAPVDIATFYQKENNWQCDECASYVFPLDKIVAWRYCKQSVPKGVPQTVKYSANYKHALEYEYLVKWVGRSYRRLQWVPHMWLLSTHHSKLRHFALFGTKVQLTVSPAESPQTRMNARSAEELLLSDNDDDEKARRAEHSTAGPPVSIPDAEEKIPLQWKLVDRVLDVFLLRKKNARAQHTPAANNSESISNSSELSDEDVCNETQAEINAAFDNGEQPSDELVQSVDDWERMGKRKITYKDIDKVIWAFIKWDELPYDEATWDSPPRRSSSEYGPFELAFKRFVDSRSVVVPKYSKRELEEQETKRGAKNWKPSVLGVPDNDTFDIGQRDARLMDFQVVGVNWLCRNWYNKQQCILADEMGLGKTVQLVTFIGILFEKFNVFPSLVVVPNSTITNWVREFERWAPKLRVVPFYGESKSRDIIKKYELTHSVTKPGTTGFKFHVLVTTYDTVSNNVAVFAKVPRWEVLVVDEGQRLKNDSNVLFRRLNDLKSHHRILMTGTPLNNNIRELFNLMNFLDPDQWDDLTSLEKEYEELNDELIHQLHERLRPYFLRRIKADVMKLPPKNEVIVPVSMTPLQKEVYKSILSQNVSTLRTLSANASTRTNKVQANFRNVLMELRKCIQHPYLVSDDIEPKGLNPLEAHTKLIDASAKLRLLKLLLPKLRQRGHRVLIFSQFVIALNILEDFLHVEGYKFKRLDGNTKQLDRQKDMDEFNKDGSDLFIFLLTTRAGGVGINLWSADTVIIFDPDFNPHQDLQAIARAHRFGQTKTCLVFKLMTKDSAEERIMQAGKKKLVLDHLIVQKMDEDKKDAEEVKSILMHGAKALFEEGDGKNIRDITYSDLDIDQLIDKTEQGGDQQEKEESSKMDFSFARIFSTGKDLLEEMPDESDAAQDEADSWAQILAQLAQLEAATNTRTVESSGRGAKRKAAQKKTSYFEGGSPDKRTEPTHLARSHSSSDDEYVLPEAEKSDADAEDDTGLTGADAIVPGDEIAQLNPSMLPPQRQQNSAPANPLAGVTNINASVPTTSMVNGPVPYASLEIAELNPNVLPPNRQQNGTPVNLLAGVTNINTGLPTTNMVNGSAPYESLATQNRMTPAQIKASLPSLDRSGDQVPRNSLAETISALATTQVSMKTVANKPPLLPTTTGLINNTDDVPTASTSYTTVRHQPVTQSSPTKGWVCGLCWEIHPAKSCFKVQNPKNLAAYREILVEETRFEDFALRCSAVNAIDTTLAKGGNLHLIAQQRHRPIEHPINSTKRPRSIAEDNAGSRVTKLRRVDVCPICNRSPDHVVYECPAVSQGQKSSISDSLTRLSGQPEHHDRARILMTLLRKQKQDMEVALRTSTYMNGNPSSNGQS